MKNRHLVRISTIWIILLYCFIGALLCIGFPNKSYTIAERNLYICLLLSYFVVVGLVVIAITRHQLYLFEPFSIISALYIGIFIYQPIRDILDHAVSYAGISLENGGSKATLLFTIGYIAFYLGYYSIKRNISFVPANRDNDNPATIHWLIVSWIIFYTFCIISSISQGFSIEYLFSLSMRGERVINENNTALLFLSNFATSLLVVWLMIMVKSKNTALKVFLTIPTIAYLIIRNARWLILIMGISPFVYYYTKKRKRVRFFRTLVLGSLMLLVFSWMQINRYNIIHGREIEWFREKGGLSIDFLMLPLRSDLSTYKTFYGMIQNFPSRYPYMLGRTFIYVFILFIPRAIWAEKPDNPIRDMVENSLGSLARSNGQAVANIGEFYANFGIIGVILLMFLFGYIASTLKKLYENPTENRLFLYSIMYPLLFQWVARGNFSGNVYYTLFSFIPFILQNTVKRFYIRRKT